MPTVSATSLAFALQLFAGAYSEVAAGVLPAPVALDHPQPRSEGAVTVSVAPSVGVQETTRRGARFRAAYSPRAFWRLPNQRCSVQQDDSADATDQEGCLRPALLHQLAFAVSPVLEERTTLTMASSLTMGQLDYVGVRQVFGETQANAPIDDSLFIEVFALNAAASLRYMVSRRWTLVTEIPWSYSTTPPTVADIEGDQDSQLFGFRQDAIHRLTPTDSLRFAIASQYALFPIRKQVSVEASVGWGKRLMPTLASDVSVGVGRIQEVGSPADGQQKLDPQYYGVGSASLSRTRETGSDSIRFALDARLDPFLFELRPQASLLLATAHQVSRRVSFVADAAAYAVAFVPSIDSSINESGANASASVVWSRQYQVRGGVRAGFRAPNLVDDFAVREKMAMLYASINWSSLAD